MLFKSKEMQLYIDSFNHPDYVRTSIIQYILLFLCCLQTCWGQKELPDTLRQTNSIWKYESYIIPGAMISYGYISLFSDKLQSYDRKIKDKVGSDKRVHLDDYLIYAPVISHGILSIAGVQSQNTFSDQLGLYGLSTVLNAVMVYPVKRLTLRERPDQSDLHSFPSGHTSNAFVGAEFFWQEHKNKSPVLACLGYVTASVTGYLRIHNNKHWLSDVLAGAGTGIISTKLMYHFYPDIKKLISGKNKSLTVVPIVQSGFAGACISIKIE